MNQSWQSMQYREHENDEDILVLDIPSDKSSLLRKLEYDEIRGYLSVYVKYSDNPFVYENVPFSIFEEFTKTESLGKFYIEFIKPNFKQVKRNFMSEERKGPPTKNEASNKTRRIDFDIDVRKLVKEWIFAGKKGDYLKCQLVMKPDGEMDDYGQLGFVTQPVPRELYLAAEKEKKGSGKLISSPILGNAREYDWDNYGNSKESIEDISGATLGEPVDDLPF